MDGFAMTVEVWSNINSLVFNSSRKALRLGVVEIRVGFQKYELHFAAIFGDNKKNFGVLRLVFFPKRE